MSFRRQPLLTPADERHLVVRTLIVRCAPGIRTSSPTDRWHRLIAAAEGVMIVRTPEGSWSTPTSNAVWVPAGLRADLETCGNTSLQMMFVRHLKGEDTPDTCRVISVSTLLREVLARI